MSTKEKETLKEFDFKIGADPEFILTMQGRKVDAKQTMEIMLKNKPDLRKVGMGYTIKDKNCGDIGWDGADSTGEIRPSASNDPKKVINNLGTLLKIFTKYIKLCDMSTISEYSSIGGHIHLEVPKGEHWSREKENLIHRRLASFYLPVLISENKTNLNLRLRQSYGSIKDHRIENKFTYEDGADGKTFEFRCPSAEWLTTPKLAEATLAYMAVVYHEILKHPKNFSNFNDIVYKSDKQGDALQTLAIMEFELLTDNILQKARKYVRTFEMYPQYKNEIEYIFNPKQIIKDKQKADFNIALGWKLLDRQSVPKKSEILSSKKKIMSIAKQKDFDILKQVMNIHHNDDTNVGVFVENLKDRVAAFNWKLKNNYFIFGIRKGINEIITRNLKGEYLTGKNIIKTELDHDAISRLFDKMNNKFNSNIDRTLSTTLDFTTGKPKDLRESIILIGLPYGMRVSEEIKPFLNLIWSLEKGEITSKNAINNKNEQKLINDCNLPDEQKGEIYKILNRKIETNQQEVVMDNGSTSLRHHLNAVDQMINEFPAN